MTSRSSALLLLTLILVGLLSAGTTGKIAGKVVDAKTGEALVGVNVVIPGTTLGASTNADGLYSIINIPPNIYRVRASILGYDPVELTGVGVSIDLTTRADFSLGETVMEQKEIIITADRPVIQKDLTAKTAVVGGEQIAALPVTEVSQVLSLQAGFVKGSLRGGRSGEVAYWIDGVPVTDAFNGDQIVEVNKSLVQELQLVSGAFNAEYGQALSGIVNIATKEGGSKFNGTVGFYGGQYATSDADLFPGLGEFKPTNIRNMEASLSGPVIGENISFFANGRYIYFDGYLKGSRKFNPWNIAYTNDLTRTFTLFRDTASGRGDGSVVPMNSSERAYGQGKLTWRIAPMLKLNADYIYDYNKNKAYNRAYTYNPDGVGNNYSYSNTLILQLTHTLNSSTFYTIGASYFGKLFRYYLYDLQYAPAPDGSADLWEVVQPGTNRYVHPKLSTTDDVYSFLTGGTDPSFFKRSTITKLLKAEVTTQAGQTNLIKAGIEYRRHNILFDAITLAPIPSQSDFVLATDNPFIRTRIQPDSTNFHDLYNHAPTEFSGYIQDKIEFKDFIVNIGLRYDYFQPDGVVVNDESDPSIYSPIKPANLANSVDTRRTYWYRKASAKWKWSPRFGASFPITATGVVHFSYGHFFQIPRFERLYENPNFKLGQGTGNVGVVGNADLEPEQTINGEIGLQQQVSEDVSLDLTAYLRDIRNLTGTRAAEIVLFGGSAKYNKYVNSDFGTVKGIVLTVNKRFGGGFQSTLDYTYQVARGSASDPQEARNAVAGGSLPEVQLTPLGWDQRHTLNVTAAYNTSRWGASVIGQYGSGSPYTPRRSTDITTLLTNSQDKPAFFNLDMRAFYEVPLDILKMVLYARVFNLFDIRNEVNVFDDTGRAGFTLDEQYALSHSAKQRVNTVDEFYRIPTNYSEPRRIEVGLNLEF